MDQILYNPKIESKKIKSKWRLKNMLALVLTDTTQTSYYNFALHQDQWVSTYCYHAVISKLILKAIVHEYNSHEVLYERGLGTTKVKIWQNIYFSDRCSCSSSYCEKTFGQRLFSNHSMKT